MTSAPLIVRFRTNNFNFGNDTFYFDNIGICGTTSVTATADVDETDPDIPNGATLTTGNDPQTVPVVPGGTVATADVGYQPLPLTFTKTSDVVGGEVVPGQTITYTLETVNYTAVTQTGVSLVDPLPAGHDVPGRQRQLAAPVFRVTEYFLGGGDFTGTSYDLTLDQALASDYFAIVQGSDGDGSSANDRGPDENYAALTDDPFGTGDLGNLGNRRRPHLDPWQTPSTTGSGVVTVVECLRRLRRRRLPAPRRAAGACTPAPGPAAATPRAPPGPTSAG